MAKVKVTAAKRAAYAAAATDLYELSPRPYNRRPFLMVRRGRLPRPAFNQVATLLATGPRGELYRVAATYALADKLGHPRPSIELLLEQWGKSIIHPALPNWVPRAGHQVRAPWLRAPRALGLKVKRVKARFYGGA